MQKLSGDYNRGFTAGLMAARDQMNSLVNDLELDRKRLNHKQLRKAFDLLIQHREAVREKYITEDEYSDFLRFNRVTKEVEWYDGKDL